MFRKQTSPVLTSQDAFRFLDDQIFLVSQAQKATAGEKSLPEVTVARAAKERLEKLPQLNFIATKVSVDEKCEAIRAKHQLLQKHTANLALIQLIADVCQFANNPRLDLDLRQYFLNKIAGILYSFENVRAQQSSGWVQLCSQELQEAKAIQAAETQELAEARVRWAAASRERIEKLRRERNPLGAMVSDLFGIFVENRNSFSGHASASGAQGNQGGLRASR